MTSCKIKRIAENWNNNSESFIILDWDDTLLPSTWLDLNGLIPTNKFQVTQLHPHVKERLDNLSRKIEHFLRKILALAPVFIVTSSEKGWVSLSCRLFLPKLYNYFSTKQIRVISARECYENKFGKNGNPSVWKKDAIENLAKFYFLHNNSFENSKQFAKHIVSIGDSIAEKDASHSVSQKIADIVVKTVTLVQLPDIDELGLQIDIVVKCIHKIFHEKKTLDLKLSRSHLLNADCTNIAHSPPNCIY